MIMDFFQRNMDTIKGKFPQMSNVPKLPKLKTRKIFANSRDNLSSQYDDSNQPIKHSTLQLSSPRGGGGAVDLTPTRIGTISSLVDGASQSNFNIPEEFIGRSPMGGRRRIRFSDSNLSDINQIGLNNDQNRQQQNSSSSSGSTATANGTKTRFTERLTKQYKELSEFKLSHLFGKKTVVRKTEIEVKTYLHGFQQDGIDNHNYSHDESGFGSGMDIGSGGADIYNRKRRISEMSSNFNVDIKQLPSGSEPSPLPKPKAALKMPPIPMTPEMKPFVMERQMPSDKFVIITQNETPITAPLAKRKVYTPEEPESLESVNLREFESTEGIFSRSIDMERKTSVKSRRSISSNPDSLRSRSGSKKNRGMWELKRPIRIKATEDDFKNPVDASTLEATPDFRKALSNVFKKFQSTNTIPVDENEEPPPPKPSAFQKMQKTYRNRTKSESKSESKAESKSQASDIDEESEFKKQFNKIKNNTGEKLKNLIKNDTENNATTSYAKTSSTEEEGTTTTDTEDTEKPKSIDEIEKLGYGRKNLKYIEKWRIRRRREMRRNEPFPIVKSDDSEGENKDLDTTKDIEKDATTDASQLTELKKSLVKALKKRQLAREVSTDSVTEDEQQQQQTEQQPTKKGFGSLFKKQTIKSSTSVEDNLDDSTAETSDNKTTDQKIPFWKKKSVKQQRISADELAKSSDNILSEDETCDKKPDPHKKVSLLNKAKNKVEKLKAMKKPSVDASESEKITEKQEKSMESPTYNKYLDALDDVDEETARAIEEMERNVANGDFKPASTWQTTKINTGGEYSSGSEESITTPGFLAHDNAPDSETYVSSEPTVIILSGPMPALMTLPSRVPSDLRHLYPTLSDEIEDEQLNIQRSSSPIPCQNRSNMEMQSSLKTSSARSPATLREPPKASNNPSPNRSKPSTPVSDLYERPRSSSPVRYKINDTINDSPSPPRSNLIKSAGFHDLASASLSSSFDSPVLGRRDYQSNTQPPSLSPSAFQRSLSPSFLAPPKGSPPPLPTCSPPPLLDISSKIYPDLPPEFEDALGLSSDIMLSHKFNFKPDALQIILESPNSATNSLDVVELSIESPTTPPFLTPVQSPPVPKRTIPKLEELPIPKLNSPVARIRTQNETQKIELNSSAIPRPRHSRKPSMDKPVIETTPAIARNIRSPIIGLNKIEEKTESGAPNGSENVKLWSSVDIFNVNDEAFTDFDEQLRNVPIIPITIEKQQELLNLENANTREYKSMSPRLEKSTELLTDLNQNILENSEITLSSDEDNDDIKIPTGVPVIPEQYKPTKPVVKQGSMRRQFSDEKDAEDLNKNIDVYKLRSKFESSDLPPRPPERMSFRKYEKVQVMTVTENNQSEKNPLINNEQKFTITKTVTKEPVTTPLLESTTITAPPPLLPRKTKLIKQPSSLEVETDGSDTIGDIYEPLQDFVGNSRLQHQQQKDGNRRQAIPIIDVPLTSTATLKAIQAKQQYEANLKAKEENLSSSESPASTASSSATSTVSTILTTKKAPPPSIPQTFSSAPTTENIVIGKSSTVKILQHQQQHQLIQEKQQLQQQQQQQQQHKEQMSMNTTIKENKIYEINNNSRISIVDNHNNEPQSIKLATEKTSGTTSTTVSPKTTTIKTINTNSNIQQFTDGNPQSDTTTTTGVKIDEGYSYDNERIKISDLKKDEMFYSLDDEEYQQYSLSGPTIVKELYTIEI